MTNSNVVFGVLQQETAHLAGRSVALMLAAQTAGGLAGKEGPVLKTTLRYGLEIMGGSLPKDARMPLGLPWG